MTGSAKKALSAGCARVVYKYLIRAAKALGVSEPIAT